MRRRRSVGPERSRGICATVAMRNLPFWGRHAPSNSGWQAQSEFECRNRNHAASGKLSAHATGLAVDVAGFDLANGNHLLVTEATDQAKVGVLRTLRTYSGQATGRSTGPTVAPTALASLAFASFFARIASISASAAATPDFGLAATPRFGGAIPTGANSIAAGRLFSTNSGAFLRWAPTPAATKASRTGLVSPAQPTRVVTTAAQNVAEMHRRAAHLAVAPHAAASRPGTNPCFFWFCPVSSGELAAARSYVARACLW